MSESVQVGGFDPRVIHERDPHTGRVIRENPFRLYIHNGTRYYEWPKASGNLWWEDRTPAGRLDAKGIPVRDVEHVEWAPPITEDERISRLNMTLDQENKRLQKELESIKREQELEAGLAKPNKYETSLPKNAKLKS